MILLCCSHGSVGRSWAVTGHHRLISWGPRHNLQSCDGESGGNGALYATWWHLIAPFAEREAKTVLDLLHSLGVEDQDIRFDNFGG